MLKDTRKKNVRGNSSSVQASEVFCSGLRNSFYGLTTQVMGRVRPNVPNLQQVGESQEQRIVLKINGLSIKKAVAAETEGKK